MSAGLICVCVPTLAALAHRRRPTRPSDSIVQGRTNSRHINFPGPKTYTSLDEQGLWDGSNVELQRRNSDIVGVLVPPAAVVTGIRGGWDAKYKLEGEDGSLDTGRTRTGEELDAANRAAGIVTTVRMEHSYV